MLQEYLSALTDTLQRGDAREESYYSTLAALMMQVGTALGHKPAITTLPKQTEAGNPDFRVWDGRQHVTGYIEAKEPTANLDTVERSPQLKRYLGTFPNVVLTNFFEFRLYRDGERVASVLIGRPVIARKVAVPPVEHEAEFMQLMERFFSFRVPRISTASGLAAELAKRTRFLRDEVVAIEMAEEEKAGRKALRGFYDAFRQYLIATISEQQFADLYAQTLTYGLFAARTRATGSFTRQSAFQYIPNTIGILRDVFQFISLGNPPQSLTVLVDDIAEVLEVTDVPRILHEYFVEGKGSDPIIHFYESFLAQYDPSVRERRGVYYTPEPVVHYIVHSLHHLLKERFGRMDGFASDGVTVLDPAGGTLTFPAEAVKLALDEFTTKYGTGGREQFIRQHILPHFFAFELMMAPYAIGHLKMGFLLDELGYTMGDHERFRLYLTNTLEMEDLAQVQIPGLSSLSEESHEAAKVKKETPILVVMGNPPYSGHSSNPSETVTNVKKGSDYKHAYYFDKKEGRVQYKTRKATRDMEVKQKNFIGELLTEYFFVDGKPLGEKNPKWLQDDYVKFIRIAQWKIDQNGEGVLGFITNHSYLDNLTFRGMRRSLMNTFNELYIINLHGNSLKKETAPDGSADQNVFDIRQGVAIIIGVKVKSGVKHQIRHFDLYGTRAKKYDWLESHTITNTKWAVVKPTAPFYLFNRQDNKLLHHYQLYPSIQDIFPVNSVGIVTARDHLTIKDTPEEVMHTVRTFAKMDAEMARDAFALGPDTRDWQVKLAQQDLANSGLDKNKVKPILYRPFDVRYTYYTGRSRGFHCMPRGDVMPNMFKENLGLIVPRQLKEKPGAFITNTIIGHKTYSAFDINYIFPLYLYPSEKERRRITGTAMLLFEPEEEWVARKANINPELWAALRHLYGSTLFPEQVMHYCYAILHSTTYRQRYAEFLKIDFPRMPFTKDVVLFIELATLGQRLESLHLLRGHELDPHLARYQGSGSDVVEKPVYNEAEQRVYINSGKYFEGVPPEVWGYHIGGYQVCAKYLKDRKGHTLTDPRHYARIVTALARTIAIQAEIDAVYEGVEKGVVAFSNDELK